MTTEFTPFSFEKLLEMILEEYIKKKSIFNIPDELFFSPNKGDVFQIRKYGLLLETPIGVAAGPHTQLAQNIISAWLCGARYIELKTVQTLDDLDISKPCIDMEDEGYNCEWSQELRLEQSFDEYLKAWVIIHILRHMFDHNNGYNEELGTIFNMSVGYNLEGIKKKNVQEFLDKMGDTSKYLKNYIRIAKRYYKHIDDIEIPATISNNITLSTMHGCPPEEIEKIAVYLIKERGYHTTIKFNPTLLGPEMLRDILNNCLGFLTEVPDIAFEHDPKFDDALEIIKNVDRISKDSGKEFSIKLTNTLESKNNKDIFPEKEEMMYMSGRPLHVIDVNLAKKIMFALDDYIPISFSGGANCFNVADLLSANIHPITMSTDILKPGGYGRLLQYTQEIKKRFSKVGAKNLNEFIINTAHASGFNGDNIFDAAKNNIDLYASNVLDTPEYKRDFLPQVAYKSSKKLDSFDCTFAPCTMECPVDQEVPDYMYFISKDEVDNALRVVLADNPLPTVAGRVCDHKCITKCLRRHYDEPLKIREIKRYITENGRIDIVNTGEKENDEIKVAIIGAGPAGLSSAYFLAKNNIRCTIFERKHKAAGMARFAIPAFRLTDESIDVDINRLKSLGVEFKFNVEVGRDILFDDIRRDYSYIIIAIGAQKGKLPEIQGINSKNVFDAIEFLHKIRTERISKLEGHVIVIGGGNSAMDAARSAWRIADRVTLVYRRTIREMPADREEIGELIKEGIEIIECASPIEINSDERGVKSVVFQAMKLVKDKDSNRLKPIPIKGKTFELDCNVLVFAIGQEVEYNFIPDSIVRNNVIIADDKTLETSEKGVYVIGDALRGPSTLIKAMGDGKLVALHISNKISFEYPIIPSLNIRDLIVKKSRRVYSKVNVDKPVSERKNFKEDTRTLTSGEAQLEAARCLSCNQFCGICVSVCPNRANYLYKVEPFSVDWPIIMIDGREYHFEGRNIYEITQRYQILNIGDACNECGNCTTFCPTSGAPYRDKPRLYISEDAFKTHNEDGFMIERGEKTIRLIGRFNNKMHYLSVVNDSFIYENNDIKVYINENIEINKVDVKEAIKCCYDLKEAFRLLVILKGIINGSILI